MLYFTQHLARVQGSRTDDRLHVELPLAVGIQHGREEHPAHGQSLGGGLGSGGDSGMGNGRWDRNLGCEMGWAAD